MLRRRGVNLLRRKGVNFSVFSIIDQALGDLLAFNNRTLRDADRLDYFKAMVNKPFTRKDYMNTFKNLSSATASRDLLKGVKMGLITKEGEKNQTVYRFT